ncbi:MAG: hypothetical protein QMD21_07775 [Candidatus Thermoplasmatota archaeon]|nr:hypothetical protein [Candidatus Thermoplasmatota archaeon]
MRVKETSHYRVLDKDHLDLGDAIEHAVNELLNGANEVVINAEIKLVRKG